MSKVRTKHKKDQQQPVVPIEWTRADPAELARFDPATKRCSMNCGKSALDPRSYNELKFLCDDCYTVSVKPGSTTSDKYRAELYDEVWQKAKDMGFGNVTMALAELAGLRTKFCDLKPIKPQTCNGKRCGWCKEGAEPCHYAQPVAADVVQVLRDMSREAQSTLVGMVDYCLERRVCMGMDEGFKSFEPEVEHDFVQELRDFVAVGEALLTTRSADATAKAGE